MASRLPARWLAAVCLAAVCVGALSACANTLQDRPIPHNELEYMVATAYPVYWLGASFQGLNVSEANHDPSDAWSVRYGDCVEGGEGSCTARLLIVTSPDNGFLPGGSAPGGSAAASAVRATHIRGVPARIAQGGDTIILAAGPVVVSIYATNPTTAAAAARTAVPINEPTAVEAPLPAALPNTGFGETPLPDQVPSPLRVIPESVLHAAAGSRAQS